MTVGQRVRLARHAGDLDEDGHDTYGASLTIAAADVSIADAGTLFTATDVEAALQELAKKDIGYTAHGALGTTETFSALTGYHSGTFSANCTATFSGATSGLVASMVLELTSDGSSVMTWPGSVVWAGGSAPTLSTTPGHVDVILFMSRDGGTIWYGFPTGGSTAVDLSAIDFLVGTASGLLSAEIVVGTTPGGELGGTWGTPTVDATHSGSTHAATQAAAEATAAAALAAHVASGSGIGGHAHVVSEAHLSNGSTTLFTLDQAFEDGSVIAWNTTTLARLGVTETQPDQATVSAAGTTGDTIMFDYAATVV